MIGQNGSEDLCNFGALSSGLVEQDEQRQVSTLLYCMGEEADEVLTSTNATAEERSNYDEVVSGFFRV